MDNGEKFVVDTEWVVEGPDTDSMILAQMYGLDKENELHLRKVLRSYLLIDKSEHPWLL